MVSWKKPAEGFFQISMQSFLDYLKGVRGEMKHVSWPSTNQAVGYTALVVFISLLVAALLGAFDFVFTYLIELFIAAF